MVPRLARCSLAAALGLALAAIALAQPAAPTTQASPGQTGILIGRQPAAAQPDAKDARAAHKAAPALVKPSGASQGIMMPPGNARAAGGQDESQGPTGGQKHRTPTPGALANQGGQGGQGSGGSGQGGQGSQMRRADGPTTLPAPALRAKGGHGQDPLGVQVREGAGAQGRGPAQNLPGQDLAGQPNPAAAAAAKAQR